MTRADLLAAVRGASPESLPALVGVCAEAQALAAPRILREQPAPEAGTALPESHVNLSAQVDDVSSGVAVAALNASFEDFLRAAQGMRP